MRDRSLSKLFVVLAMLSWSIACQKAETTNSNSNSAPTNVSPSTNSATPNTPSSTPNVNANISAVSVSLSTPTDAYKTGYAARKNKDIATLKRVLSKDALAFLTEIAQIDKKTLDDQLKELADKPQAASAETRNEKINGNRASLEYLDEDGKWSSMEFTKDGSDWKIDLPKGP
jgi:hypothetical protein